MGVQFTGDYATNTETFGINFQATFNGKAIVCVISTEALDDIDPSNRTDSTENKFINNRQKFQNIAEQKILNDEVENNKVLITSDNVTS